jgi:cytochrome bd-type quinol oxidase subunit 1
MASVKTIREKNSLTQKEFVHELEPLMKKRMSVITVDMLRIIEGGGKIDADRMKIINESINERFSERVVINNKVHVSPFAKRIMVGLASGMVLIGSILLYMFTPLRNDVTNIVSIISGLAGILALSMTIFKIEK